MSDVVERAKALASEWRFEAAGELVPDLVAELERLQQLNDNQAATIALVADRMSEQREEIESLSPEWGWDVMGRKKPNPTVINGNDGRPVVDKPRLAMTGARLYRRLVSGWEPAP